MTEKEKLLEIYQRISLLKNGGVKMKDIADRLDLAPSVLSALYATILPSFSKSIEKMDFNDALEEALTNVNNLSKKRLLNNLDMMYKRLGSFDFSKPNKSKGEHPFLKFLREETVASTTKADSFEGLYMAYTCSSSMQMLKAEPFYLTISKEKNALVAGRKSIHNSLREGIGIIKEQQILYLMFNAFREPNISLVTIYLQLPFLEEINILKGLYIVLDYNKNPIARRIVLMKKTNHYSEKEFSEMDAKLISPNNFTEEERLLFDYTCEDSDSLKMCTLPSPKLDLRDLQFEKRLLEKEKEILKGGYGQIS